MFWTPFNNSTQSVHFNYHLCHKVNQTNQKLLHHFLSQFKPELKDYYINNFDMIRPKQKKMDAATSMRCQMITKPQYRLNQNYDIR